MEKRILGCNKKGRVFADRLLKWFSSEQRDFPWRHEADPYRIIVVEKLLQQTTYGHVMKVYDTFFDTFPNVQDLARADARDIEAVIRRLGFQRQRAPQFKEMASALLETYAGEIPSTKEDLLTLSGVGDYVANATLCFAFNKDVAIVDLNVRRVVGRYFDWRELSDREIERRLGKLIPKGKAKQFNWGIIDFSNLVCARKPRCKTCFLNDLCSYFQSLRGGT